MVVAFRADASTEIGVGHIMRCLSLADGLKKRGAECVFICKDYPGNMCSRIEQQGFRVETVDIQADIEADLDMTSQIIRNHKVDILITDSYAITADYLRKIKTTVDLLVSIDDTIQTHFCSDILLNQNLGAREKDYRDMVEPSTKLLLGPAYALLRDEFADKRPLAGQTRRDAGNVLITMGGGDPDDQTSKAVKALADVDSLELVVLLGPSYRHSSELERFVDENCNNVTLLKDSLQLADKMLWADLALSAGGSTCWELACMGAPNVVMVLAKNQEPIARELDKQGISINLGWFEDISGTVIKSNVLELLNNPQKREQMSKKGQQLVDGRGVERVVGEIVRLLETKKPQFN